MIRIFETNTVGRCAPVALPEIRMTKLNWLQLLVLKLFRII